MHVGPYCWKLYIIGYKHTDESRAYMLYGIDTIVESTKSNKPTIIVSCRRSHKLWIELVSGTLISRTGFNLPHAMATARQRFGTELFLGNLWRQLLTPHLRSFTADWMRSRGRLQAWNLKFILYAVIGLRLQNWGLLLNASMASPPVNLTFLLCEV